MQSGLGDTAQILQAVRRSVVERTAPSRDAVVGQVLIRCGPTAGQAVEAVLAGSSGRSLRRHLRNAGLVSPHEWTALVGLVQAANMALREKLSMTELCRKLRVHAATVTARCHRLTCMTWPELCELTSWEAMLEAGMWRRDRNLELG